MEKEQIIKALEVCANYQNFGDCDKCPAREGCDNENGFLEKEALSLIREQEKENERLKARVLDENHLRTQVEEMLAQGMFVVKTDTVRKMHKLIKERCIKGGIYPAFVKNVVEAVAKELLEDVTPPRKAPEP